MSYLIEPIDRTITLFRNSAPKGNLANFQTLSNSSDLIPLNDYRTNNNPSFQIPRSKNIYTFIDILSQTNKIHPSKSRSPPPLDSRMRHCSFAPRSFLFSRAVSTPRTRQQCGPPPPPCPSNRHPPLSIDLIVSHREQAGQLSQRGQRITANTGGLDNKPCALAVFHHRRQRIVN